MLRKRTAATGRCKAPILKIPAGALSCDFLSEIHYETHEDHEDFA
jgi:hypothetical protein